MELLQLKYFKIVAEVQNMTKVAEELHISQPALSKTIKSLEKELGVPLFNRVGRNIQLNNNGLIFLKYVNNSLQSLEDAKKEIKDQNSDTYSDITICVQAGLIMLPQIISEFNKMYPKIKLHVTQKQFLQKNIVNKNNYDFIIKIPEFDEVNDENTITLLNEELLLAVPKSHKISKYTSLELKELSDENFIGLPTFSKLRKATDHYCEIVGFTPNVILECYDSNVVIELVKEGLGICFMPKYSWGYKQHQDISLIKIYNPKCTRSINLSWDENSYFSKSSELFKNFIIDFFNNYSEKNG